MPPRASLLLGLLLVARAAADIAPEPLVSGGTSMAPRQKDVAVEMLWEEVDIRPSVEKNRVEAVFRLRNTSDRVEKFEVGFPDFNRMPLRDFQVEVDGKAQAASEKKEGSEERSFLVWMCWEMEFAAKQERTVKVTYWVPMKHIHEHLEYEKLPDDLKATIWPYESGYVMRTGAGWKGNIGKAVIRLHYGGQVVKALTTDLEPEMGWQFDAKAGVDTLTLEDFEPGDEEAIGAWNPQKYDVRFQFTTADPKKEVELLLEAAKAKRLDPWALQYLLEWLEKGGNPRRIEDIEDLIYGEEDAEVKKRLEDRLARELRTLPLSEAERKALALETLEWMVPPQGPEFDQSQMFPGDAAIVRTAYGRLFAHYRDSGATDKAVAVGVYYRKFMQTIVDFWEDKADPDGSVGRVREKARAELKPIVEYLEEHGAGEAPE